MLTIKGLKKITRTKWVFNDVHFRFLNTTKLFQVSLAVDVFNTHTERLN